MRWSIQILPVVGLLLTCSSPTFGEDPPASSPVEIDRMTGWKAVAAAKGTKLYSDRDYVITAFPEEMKGAILVQRPAGGHSSDTTKRWLTGEQVKIKRPCMLYLVVNTITIGKRRVDEDQFKAMERRGWEAVKQSFERTTWNKQQHFYTVWKKKILFPGAFEVRDIGHLEGNAALFFFFR